MIKPNFICFLTRKDWIRSRNSIAWVIDSMERIKKWVTGLDIIPLKNVRVIKFIKSQNISEVKLKLFDVVLSRHQQN